MQSPRVRKTSVTAMSEQEEKGSFCDRYHTRTGGGSTTTNWGPRSDVARWYEQIGVVGYPLPQT